MRTWLFLPLIAGCVIVTETDKDVADTDTDTGTTTTDTDTDPTGETGDTAAPDPDDDMDGFPASVDCDDTNPDINPDALEICDGIDNDCADGTDDVAEATIAGTNYPSVDEAISSVVDGDIIDLCPGTFSIAGFGEQESGFTLRGVQGRDLTTLQEVAGGVLASVSGTGSLTFEGVTITGTTAADSAILVEDTAVLTLTDSAISGNSATGLSIVGAGAVVTLTGTDVSSNTTGVVGGGIRAFGSFDLDLTDSSISGNTAAQGGGIYAEITFGVGDIALTNTTVTTNVADDGGGIMVLNVPIIGDGVSTIAGNTANFSGGGVASVRSPVSGVTLSTNTALMGGGVAALYDPAFVLAPLQPDLTDVALSANLAEQGAGVFVDQGETVIMSSTTGAGVVSGNIASLEGGGAYLTPQGTLQSVGMDWTKPGSTDNAPDDVWTPAGGYPNLGPDFMCTGLGGCL